MTVNSDDKIEEGFLSLQDDESDEGSVAILPLAKDPDDPIPALRELQARMLNVGPEGKSSGLGAEETVVLLSDPEGLAPKQAALSTWAYALATLFDGLRTAREVAEEFGRKYGQPVPVEQALELQRELDKANFLYSERFEKALKKQLQTFLECDVRPAVHAGTSYPSEPKALEVTIENFFSDPDGPGALNLAAIDKTLQTGAPMGLVLPHIDLQVGGATYAHGYKHLIENSQAELIFILGIAHKTPGEGMFFVSRKDYDTPLGVLKTEKSIAARLQAAAGIKPDLAEMAHRTEHSIEFQAVLLSALLAKGLKREIQIVPVLCGFIDSYLIDDVNPFGAPEFVKFTRALRAELENCNRPWSIMCSVDLSHVGPEFGHSTMMTEKLLPPLERADRKLLKIMESMDATGVYNEIVRTQNSRHVDAVIAVLTMLQACDGIFKTGRLLDYSQMLKNETHSAVSYASMLFQ